MGVDFFSTSTRTIYTIDFGSAATGVSWPGLATTLMRQVA